MSKYIFGKTSNNRLLTCHEDLQTLFRAAITDPNCPFDFFIAEGHRTDEAQQRAYDEGHSLALPGQSPHNQKISLAVDAVPVATKWDSVEAFEELADHICLVAERLYSDNAIEYRIEWGGEWRFTDRPHYQIRRWKELRGE